MPSDETTEDVLGAIRSAFRGIVRGGYLST
jgi:hypothetical protein